MFRLMCIVVATETERYTVKDLLFAVMVGTSFGLIGLALNIPLEWTMALAFGITLGHALTARGRTRGRRQ